MGNYMLDKNIGLYFLKTRYSNFYLGGHEFDSRNSGFPGDNENYSVKAEKKNDYSELNFQKLTYSINYPGLLIGVGTTIGIQDKGINDFKIGLYFDYTTGIPVVPGSSLKGTLRSFFPNMKETEESRESKRDIINYFLKKEYSFEELEKIENCIFAGIIGDKNIPMRERDKFIEGILDIPQSNIEILEKDYLTPHKEILKNPVPLKFLKIKEGMGITFYMDLKDSQIGDIVLTKSEKLELFDNILMLMGIGAKRNTGYGQFNQENTEILRKKEIELDKKLENEKIRRQEEAEKEAKKKQLDSLPPLEKFRIEFTENWTNEERDRNYPAALENFSGAEKIEGAKIYLEYFKSKPSPNKKTKQKIEDLTKLIS